MIFIFGFIGGWLIGSSIASAVTGAWYVAFMLLLGGVAWFILSFYSFIFRGSGQ